MVDEAERSIHDVLCVLTQVYKDKRAIYGGGNTEMRMAEAVEQASKTVPGKKALAMEAYARALRTIPAIVADNAGLDSAELVATLKAKINAGGDNYGVDV